MFVEVDGHYNPWFVNTSNYCQGEVGLRKKTASLFFYPTAMASKSIFLSGKVFFYFCFTWIDPHSTTSNNYNNANNIKNNTCMLHKFWAQKLMKTKHFYVFYISSIKHWFFSESSYYKEVHRPPVVLHSLPATVTGLGDMTVTHCLPWMMRWHWTRPSLWRAEYRSCWSTPWWFWLILRSCRWESEKSC